MRHGQPNGQTPRWVTPVGDFGVGLGRQPAWRCASARLQASAPLALARRQLCCMRRWLVPLCAHSAASVLQRAQAASRDAGGSTHRSLLLPPASSLASRPAQTPYIAGSLLCSANSHWHILLAPRELIVGRASIDLLKEVEYEGVPSRATSSSVKGWSGCIII